MTIEKWHDGKIAIVTGGTSGIGLEIARTLTRRGAKVAIGGRRSAEEYGDLQDAASFFAQLDVCASASVERFVREVEGALGPIGILVNSAGVTIHHEVCDHSDEDWNSVIETNLTGPFRMIRACLPGMKAEGWGRIVNIASTAATSAAATHPAYCASKSGLLGLGRAVALEGAPHGVTCTSVSPTWVETEMLNQSVAKMANRSGRTAAQEKTALASGNPQNRLVQSTEVAETVSFLCSDMAPALTMEDIQINAGTQW